MINDIQIGPLTLHVYGIMVALGFLSALIISERRAYRDFVWYFLVCDFWRGGRKQAALLYGKHS